MDIDREKLAKLTPQEQAYIVARSISLAGIEDQIEAVEMSLAEDKEDQALLDTLQVLKYAQAEFGYGELAQLEYLRGQLRAGTISYDELAELQSLRDYIDPSDVELLEAAGVPENE